MHMQCFSSFVQATATTFMLSKSQLNALNKNTAAHALEPALMAAVVDTCSAVPTASTESSSSSSGSRVSARIANNKANSSAKATPSSSSNSSSSSSSTTNTKEAKAVDTSQWKVIVLLYCGNAPLIEELCSALQAMCPHAAIIGGVAGAGMRLVNGQVRM
jgi:hypothetical protein